MKLGVFNVYNKQNVCEYSVYIRYDSLEDVLSKWRNLIIVWGDEYDEYVLEIDTDIYQAVYDSTEDRTVYNAWDI